MDQEHNLFAELEKELQVPVDRSSLVVMERRQTGQVELEQQNSAACYHTLERLAERYLQLHKMVPLVVKKVGNLSWMARSVDQQAKDNSC